MKLSLAQANPVVGDVVGNLTKVKEFAHKAPKGTLVIFPEMMLTGYPLEDLVFSEDLQEDCHRALKELEHFMAEEALDRKIIVGYLEAGAEGEKPFNAAALISEAGIEQKSYKIALPTYGVFDERRLFSQGEKIMTGEWQGERFAVLICEDLWREDGEALAQAREAGAEVLIGINGSPFEDGKDCNRVRVMGRALELTGASYGVYLNMVGGQDDLVFDGGSFVYDGRRSGRIAQLPFFSEDISSFDTTTAQGFDILGDYTHSREKMLYQASVLGLRDYVEKNRFKGVLVGVSGGIDSALVTAMAADALGGRYPCLVATQVRDRLLTPSN